MNKEKELDWLSSLPDALLIDILSRLDATEVVQTCILSKKWLKLWTFVPCLEFRYYNFKGKETLRNEGRDLKSFENFVSTFLRLRDGATNLDSFILSVSVFRTDAKISGSAAMQWILYASKHNPKKLRLFSRVSGFIHLPECLFTCESLEDVCLELEIEDCWVQIKSDNVRLPRLRNLYFGFASFDADYMKRFLFGCPALESLRLCECALNMNNLSFQNLKKLKIMYCYFLGESTFSISAPGLKRLTFGGRLGSRVKLINMSTAIKATITTINYDEDETPEEIGYNLDLLSSLSGVETLKLESHSFKETLKAELPRCPKFHNLKNLTLGDGCMYCHFGLLCSFLKHCPNLEVLTLSHDGNHCLGLDTEEEQGQDFERFGCEHLKKIDVRHTSYDRKVIWLVQLLLQSTAEIYEVQIILSKIPI